MAHNLQLSTVGRGAMLSGVGIAPLLNSGFLKLYTGAQPANGDASITGTLLGTLTFSATAFAVSSGVATANTITSESSAPNSGTMGYAVLEKSDGTVVAMCSVGTSGADVNFSTLTVTAGDPIAVTSMTLTMPAA